MHNYNETTWVEMHFLTVALSIRCTCGYLFYISNSPLKELIQSNIYRNYKILHNVICEKFCGITQSTITKDYVIKQQWYMVSYRHTLPHKTVISYAPMQQGPYNEILLVQ